MDSLMFALLGVILGFAFRGFIAREGQVIVTAVKSEFEKIAADIKSKV